MCLVRQDTEGNMNILVVDWEHLTMSPSPGCRVFKLNEENRFSVKKKMVVTSDVLIFEF